MSMAQLKAVAATNLQLCFIKPSGVAKQDKEDGRSPEEAQLLKELVAEFPEVFRADLLKGLPPDRSIQHHIPLQPNTKPHA